MTELAPGPKVPPRYQKSTPRAVHKAIFGPVTSRDALHRRQDVLEDPPGWVLPPFHSFSSRNRWCAAEIAGAQPPARRWMPRHPGKRLADQDLWVIPRPVQTNTERQGSPALLAPRMSAKGLSPIM